VARLLIIIVLERISGVIVVVGLRLGGLSCIVQVVGLRGDEVCNDAQLAAVEFARLWRLHPPLCCAANKSTMTTNRGARAAGPAGSAGARRRVGVIRGRRQATAPERQRGHARHSYQHQKGSKLSALQNFSPARSL